MGIAKKGREHVVVLFRKQGVSREEHRINALGKTQPALKMVPIVRNSPVHHVAFEQLMQIEREPSRLAEGLALCETEGLEVNLRRQTIVEPTFAVYDIVKHPRSRRRAHDKGHVPQSGSPAVPKELQCREHAALRRVHPRELVDEDDLALVRGCADEALQEREGLQPRRRHLKIFETGIRERAGKGIELISQATLRQTRMLERERVPKRLADRRCLPNPQPAIDGNKLGVLLVKDAMEKCLLLVPAINMLPPCLSIVR